MTTPHKSRPLSNRFPSGRWADLAGRALDGHPLNEDDGLAILQSGDEELLDLLAAVYRVRHHGFGNRVDLNFLINAKSGHCGEDCGYCSQSRVSTAEIPKYRLMDEDVIHAGAQAAVERKAKTYCIVTSGRQPGPSELKRVAAVVARIKADHALKICVSPGFLTADQAAMLKAAGVDRINHNLNTSQRFYARICTTHSYQDRLATLEAVRGAGLEICSGGIIGMGEEDADVVELALRLGRLSAEAVPVNFWQPIAGTPLAGRATCEPVGTGCEPTVVSLNRLTPRYCLKVLALFRLAIPRCELRMAAGREMHLGSLQPLGLFAANSIFVGDYLTTPGQPPEADYRMIRDLGFEPVVEGKRT